MYSTAASAQLSWRARENDDSILALAVFGSGAAVINTDGLSYTNTFPSSGILLNDNFIAALSWTNQIEVLNLNYQLSAKEIIYVNTASSNSSMVLQFIVAIRDS